MMTHLGLSLLGLLSTIGSADGMPEATPAPTEREPEAACTDFLLALEPLLDPLGGAPTGPLDDRSLHALIQWMYTFPGVPPAEHLAMRALQQPQLAAALPRFAADLSIICLWTYLRGSRLAIAAAETRPELGPELRQELGALLQAHAQVAVMAPVTLLTLRTHTTLLLQAVRSGLLPHVSVTLLETVQDSLRRVAAGCPASPAPGPACGLEQSEPARRALGALLAQEP